MKSPVKNTIALHWVAAAILFLLGCVFIFIFTSIQFIGCICIGISALIVCYKLLSIYSLRNPKAAKIISTLLSACICIGLIAALITGVIIFKGSLGQPEQHCQYVVVLGAGVNGTTPSLSLRERIHGAYDYLAAHEDTICIVSGGQGDGEDITEAQCMFNELTAMGIAPERIWLEEQATSTRENLQFSLDLIENRTGSRPTEIGLVSSAYHLYRAGLFAREQNVTAYGIPAATSWISLRVNYFLREIAAVWYYFLLGG